MAGKFQPPPIQGEKWTEEDGRLSDPAFKWLQLIPPLLTKLSGNVPASSGAQGIPGQIATDGNFIYVCVASNQWKRIALTAF